MATKKQSKKKSNKSSIFWNIDLYVSLFLCIGIVTLFVIGLNNKDGVVLEEVQEVEETAPTYHISESPVPAFLQNDKGELIEDVTIPTMEEVDGGQFKDKDTGVSTTEGEYHDLGWAEEFDTSSPDAFKDATLGRCIVANNFYGAQCVSLARVFWWSYADRDVSTCGTGMAKGMMECAEENAGDDFLVYNETAKEQIQAGDWLVFNGGKYGHVGMALAPVVNGYVTLLGENQGGRACEEGGSATNIININIKNLIGYYRPKAYVKPAPKSPDTGRQ